MGHGCRQHSHKSTSRFSLILAIVLLPTRSLLHLYPLDIEAWEMLRVACDIAVAALCLQALWISLRPRAPAAPPAATEAASADAGTRMLPNPPPELPGDA